METIVTSVTTEPANRPRRILTPKQDHLRQLSNIRRWCCKYYRQRLFTEDGPPRPPADLASEVLRDALTVYSRQGKYTVIDDVAGVSTVRDNDGRARVLLYNTEEDSIEVVGFNINKRAFVITSGAAVYRELAIPSQTKNQPYPPNLGPTEYPATPEEEMRIITVRPPFNDLADNRPPVVAGPYTDSGQEVEPNDEVQPPAGGICCEVRRLDGRTTETIDKLDQLLSHINPLPCTPLKSDVAFETTDGNDVPLSQIDRELNDICYRLKSINGILDDAINLLGL